MCSLSFLLLNQSLDLGRDSKVSNCVHKKATGKENQTVWQMDCEGIVGDIVSLLQNSSFSTQQVPVKTWALNSIHFHKLVIACDFEVQDPFAGSDGLICTPFLQFKWHQ